MNKKSLAAAKLKEMTRLAQKRQSLLEEKRLRDNPALGMSLLLEGDLEQAEIALAIQSMEADIQSMAEKVAKMSVEEVMPLTDRIREQFGTDKADAFDAAANETLTTLLDAVKDTREALSQQSLIIQGKAEASEFSDMGKDDGGEMDLDGADMDLGDGEEDSSGDSEIDDLFNGSEAASGPEEEPLGRAKKESARNSKKVLESKKKIYEDEKLTSALEEISQAETVFEQELIADRHGFLLEELTEFLESNDAAEAEELLRKIRTPGSAIREALGIEEGVLGDLALTAAKWIPSPIAPIARAADALGAFDDNDENADDPKTGEDAAQAAKDEKIKKMPMVKQAIQKVSNKVAKNPAVKKVADALGVDPESAAELATGLTDSIEYSSPILEHAIVEMVDDSEMRESEAIDLLKNKMSAARAGKSIAETEAFDGGMTLSTPRSLMKQLTKKYGSPDGWQIAENDEGGYYVISERIPETLRAKEIEKTLESLDAESANLREEYGDLEEDFQLPQEIRATKLRDQLKELAQGYHHPVARWCTMDEARSIVALGRRWFGKEA